MVRVFLLEGPDPLDQLVLIHFEHVGDHTRGLFEAEASVAASAPHPLHDRAIFGIHDTSLVPREFDLRALRALLRAQRSGPVADPQALNLDSVPTGWEHHLSSRPCAGLLG